VARAECARRLIARSATVRTLYARHCRSIARNVVSIGALRGALRGFCPALLPPAVALPPWAIAFQQRTSGPRSIPGPRRRRL
jgi:hypothetical protein